MIPGWYLNRSRCRLGFGLGWAKVALWGWGCTVAPPGKYHWTIRVWRWCGLISNYFDHLLLLACIAVLHT